MRVKQENYIVVEKDVATDEMIKGCKEELTADAEQGYKGKYVPDSIVFKVYEQGGMVYVCAEWEEE